MWLFVGLGNPGEKYSGHRHNIGFSVIDEIASGFSELDSYKSKFSGLFAEVRVLNTEKIGLLKPMTYMNNSGQSVLSAAKYFKIDMDRIVVFHDELDLSFGQIKVKLGGGNAGHNGLKSIQAHLGTDKFWRVRIGIDHPGQKDLVTNHVLGNFSKAEQTHLDDMLPVLADHSDKIVSDGVDAYGQVVQSHLKPYENPNQKEEANGV